jgi:hypothetical protein
MLPGRGASEGVHPRVPSPGALTNAANLLSGERTWLLPRNLEDRKFAVSTVVVDDQTSTTQPGGVDRRTMIKRAAAAGALAWTAPMIIDSLASPAAASSNQLAAGDYLFYFLVRWVTGTCSLTLLTLAQQPNFTGSTCSVGTRVDCTDAGVSVIRALFNGTAVPIDGCSATTSACPAAPSNPNQGLCFSSNQGNASVTGFDVSPQTLVNPTGSANGAGFGCLSGGACTFGAGLEVYHPTNQVTSGTYAVVLIRVHVT